MAALRAAYLQTAKCPMRWLRAVLLLMTGIGTAAACHARNVHRGALELRAS